MEEERAREVLGVSADAAAEEIEAAFRKLAGVRHPDKGGSNDQMAELLESRDTLLGLNKRLGSDLVPVEVMRDLVRVLAVQTGAATRQQLKVLHDEFQQRSTNRLLDLRRLAAIVAAVAAGVTFFGKDLPIDDFVELSAGQQKQELELAKRELEKIQNAPAPPAPAPAPAPTPAQALGQTREPTAEEKAYTTAQAEVASKAKSLNTRIAELEGSQAQVAKWKSMLRVMAASLSMMLGMFAWALSQKIARTERDLEHFDESTETRSGFVRFLSRLFHGAAPPDWSEEEVVAVLRGAAHAEIRELSSRLGPHAFARYAIRRGRELGFLTAREIAQDSGLLEERYALKLTS